MHLIDQAIFTSADADGFSNYQVVAASPGVSDADAGELAVWGPSNDALLETTFEGASLYFHPLPSGAYCIGWTTTAGWESNHPETHRLSTQCLIVRPEVLAEFANNPFSVLKSAAAGGFLHRYQEIPTPLEPIRLSGRASPVDSTLLARLAGNPGADWMAALIQAALGSVSVTFAGGPQAENIIAGLINCLPPASRTEFSFSTGLKFSTRRPFRLVALSGDVTEQCRVERLHNLVVMQLSGPPSDELFPIDAWPQLIHRVLKSGRTSLLLSEFSQDGAQITLEELPALALQLLEELDSSALSAKSASETGAITRRARPDSKTPAGFGWAHRSHRRFAKESNASTAERTEPKPPSELLKVEDPEILKLLETLDELVHDAAMGLASALEQLKLFWPELHDKLSEDLLSKVREQYLRYSLTLWADVVDSTGVRHPQQAAQSLDILCVLFDDVDV